MEKFHAFVPHKESGAWPLILYRLPQVAEAAIIGVPDEKWGEVGRAIVVLKPGQELGEEAIIDFCRRHVGRYKVPNSVVFVDRLPRNPAGKVVKGELHERFGAA